MSVTGLGSDPLNSTWVGAPTKSRAPNRSIYPPSNRGDDGSLRDMMYDYFFEAAEVTPGYRVYRGPWSVRMGPKSVLLGPRKYTRWTGPTSP